jgi:hypothetical protein
VTHGIEGFVAMTAKRARFARVAGMLAGVLGFGLALFGVGASPAVASTGTWSTPTNVSALGAGGFGQQVASNDSGHVVVTWYSFDATTMVSSSQDGGLTWSTPASLSAPGGDAYGQRVSLNAAGQAVVVWQRLDGSYNIIQSSSSNDSGLTWSSPVDISQAGTSSSYAELALDASGNAVVVWQHSAGSNSVIQSAESSNAGGSWSIPENVSLSGGDAYGADVALDESGHAVAVWHRYNGANNIVQASSSSDTGSSWSSPVDLSSVGGSATFAQVGLNSSGKAVVVWKRSNGSNDIVQASFSANSGATWNPAGDLSDAGANAASPRLALDSNSNAVAVWNRSDGSNEIVQAAKSVDGGATWTIPMNLSEPGEDASAPQVSLIAAGGAIAIWQRALGSDVVIQASVSTDAGATWSIPENISQPEGDAFDAQVRLDSEGNAVAVWYRYSPGVDIQASRFLGPTSPSLPNTGISTAGNVMWLATGLSFMALGLILFAPRRRRATGATS